MTYFEQIGKFIADAFRSPDAFPHDPAGYAWNQTGHFLLGVVFGVFGLPGAVLGLVAALVWEARQVFWRDAVLSDSIEDFGFFLLGIGLTAVPGVGGMMFLGVFLVFLVRGATQRDEARQQRRDRNGHAEW